MTCSEVADTSLSDLAGLAQYCSSRLRSQLRKQHSSTIPRFWERLLFPLLVGLPEGAQQEIECACLELELVMNLGCVFSQDYFSNHSGGRDKEDKRHV